MTDSQITEIQNAIRVLQDMLPADARFAVCNKPHLTLAAYAELIQEKDMLGTRLAVVTGERDKVNAELYRLKLSGDVTVLKTQHASLRDRHTNLVNALSDIKQIAEGVV